MDFWWGLRRTYSEKLPKVISCTSNNMNCIHSWISLLYRYHHDLSENLRPLSSIPSVVFIPLLVQSKGWFKPDSFPQQGAALVICRCQARLKTKWKQQKKPHKQKQDLSQSEKQASPQRLASSWCKDFCLYWSLSVLGQVHQGLIQANLWIRQIHNFLALSGS